MSGNLFPEPLAAVHAHTPHKMREIRSAFSHRAWLILWRTPVKHFWIANVAPAENLSACVSLILFPVDDRNQQLMSWFFTCAQFKSLLMVRCCAALNFKPRIFACKKKGNAASGELVLTRFRASFAFANMHHMGVHTNALIISAFMCEDEIFTLPPDKFHRAVARDLGKDHNI